MIPCDAAEAARGTNGSSLESGRENRRRPAGLSPAVAMAVAIVLCLPGFRFPFLFEDYDFLARAQMPGWAKFLPDPRPILYRPVSREGYFSLLTALGGDPPVAHALNVGLVCAAVLLMFVVARRLLGSRAGLVAALLLATSSQVPLLAAWASGCQDLLAIDFILLALWLELGNRRGMALVAAGLALLSKESAVAAFPALAASGWVDSRTARSAGKSAVAYGLLAAGWAAIHPLTGVLVGRKFMGAETGYIGLDNPGRWDSLLRGTLTLFNLPTSPPSGAWLSVILLPGLVAVAAIVLVRGLLAKAEDLPAQSRFGPGRAGALGLGLALPPLLLTSLLVRHWSPYYVALPSAGACLALAALSTAAPRGVLLPAFGAYLALGLCTRAMPLSPDIPTEPTLHWKGEALEMVEQQFRTLRPSIPRGAQLLVYTIGSEHASIREHLARYKVPRWWYADPELIVSSAELRADHAGPEFLFWVGPDLAVHEVEPGTLRPRSLHGRADLLEYQRVMRAYARGLADSGELERGVAVLLRMPETRREYRDLDRRLAAMLLLKHGREDRAREILAGLPPLRAGEAVQVVANTMELRTRAPLPVDVPMRAFGLPPDDTDALRAIVRGLRERGSYRLAAGVALELLKLSPGDREAAAAAADSLRGPWPDLLTAQAP